MRDKNGRFLKTENEGIYIDLRFITIQRIIKWAIIIGVLLPWFTIISRFNPIEKIFNFIQNLMEGPKKEDLEQVKKMEYFIKKNNNKKK